MFDLNNHLQLNPNSHFTHPDVLHLCSGQFESSVKPPPISRASTKLQTLHVAGFLLDRDNTHLLLMCSCQVSSEDLLILYRDLTGSLVACSSVGCLQQRLKNKISPHIIFTVCERREEMNRDSFALIFTFCSVHSGKHWGGRFHRWRLLTFL